MIIIFVYVVQILLPRFITRIQHLSTHHTPEARIFFWGGGIVFVSNAYVLYLEQMRQISVCHVCPPSICPSVTLWDKLSFKETIQHIVHWRHTKINICWNKKFNLFSEVAFLFNLELSITLLEITSFSNKLFDIFHLTSFNFFLDELYAQFAYKTICKASDIYLFFIF